MAMLKMQRIYIYALIKYCKDILETLQRRGVVEIENMELEDSVFFKEDTSSAAGAVQPSAATADRGAGDPLTLRAAEEGTAQLLQGTRTPDKGRV